MGVALFERFSPVFQLTLGVGVVKGSLACAMPLDIKMIKRGRGTKENGIQGGLDGMPIHLWKPFSNSDCTHLRTRVGRGNMKIVTTNRIPSGLEVDLSIRCSA